MANDRILITCKYCQEHKVLFKYYPDHDTSYLWDKGLEEFLRKHIFECSPSAYRFNLAGDSVFTLSTESEPPPMAEEKPEVA